MGEGGEIKKLEGTYIILDRLHLKNKSNSLFFKQLHNISNCPSGHLVPK